VGLFIAFIGLKEAGIIVANPATTVALGDLTTPTAAVAILVGLVVIAVLHGLARASGAMLIGILLATAAGWALGLAKINAGDLQPGRPDRHGLQARRGRRLST
jgi:AGZA family xanthine/uracil permease-like MFS transporter